VNPGEWRVPHLNFIKGTDRKLNNGIKTEFTGSNIVPGYMNWSERLTTYYFVMVMKNFTLLQ
jgi:hypothetical protein